MPTLFHPPNFLVRRTLRGWVLALCCGGSLLACAQAPRQNPKPNPPPMHSSANTSEASIIRVTRITLERDCFGCSSGTRLQLQRELGLATLTVIGKARHGSVDQHSQAPLSTADFDQMAGLLQAQGFFELADRIDEPDLQDGAWTQLSVAGPTTDKQVFRRSTAQDAPSALQTIEAALDALQARLHFSPAPAVRP